MQIQRNVLESAGISQGDIQQLEAALDTYQTAAVQTVRKIPHIVCTGIYNAGKSTLLNALCGEEKFPTGDIPTTKKIAQAEFGGAVYIDTPGLNAMDEDDRETQAAYESADFILFVANVQDGGISAAEAEWLQKLKGRYGSLQQRLIYILTHCTQVEPNQLPAIREKVLGDFKKAVEFEPEQLFCVDSITYQDGTTQNEPLLTESSGIPQLKSCLAERIAGAEKILREVQAAEHTARQKNVLGEITKIKNAVQSAVDKADRASKEQIAAVDAAWAKFEADLGKAMPAQSIAPIPHAYISLAKSQSGKAGSLMECDRRVKDALRPIYNSMESKVRSAISRAEEYAQEYCTSGMDSAYFTCCNQINQVFEKAVLGLQKQGVSVSELSEITVDPDLPNNFSGEVIKYLQQNYKDSVLSLGDYVRMYVWLNELGGGPSESKDYKEKRGLFGRTNYYEETVYYYDIYSPSRYMEENLQRAMDTNIDMANNHINHHWKAFVRKVKSSTDKQKDILKKQIDTYKSSRMQASGSTSAQSAALNHLSELEKEVSR